MRRRALPVIGLSLAALAVGTALAPSVGASIADRGTLNGSAGISSGVQPSAACVSQRDNDNGKAVVSQNFEHERIKFDTWAADDFTLAKPCTANEIDIDGQYLGGSTKARSFNVTFYTNSKQNRPRSIFKVMRDQAYTNSDDTFRITFGEAVLLPEGTYWVSVRANHHYSGGGLWGWLTNNTVRGAASLWLNPGDGFATGCTTWTKTTTLHPRG